MRWGRKKAGYRKLVQDRIDDTSAADQALWAQVCCASSDYIHALGIDRDDLAALHRTQDRVGGLYPTVADKGESGFVVVPVGGEQFALTIQNVCGAPYGDSWANLVRAVCVTDADLNVSTGYGTTTITAVPPEWHDGIVRELRTGSPEPDQTEETE